jgi:outer membrane immunogenic protein
MNVRPLPLLASLLVVAPLAAVAGNTSEPAIETTPSPAVVAAPAAANWSGFYGGLSYANTSGALNQNDFSGFLFDLETSSAGGLFIGYNMQRGKFVYGGELNYTAFDNGVDVIPTSVLEDIMELRVRGGYAVSDALLVYGFLGHASGSFDDSGVAFFDLSGVSYGMGADYLLTDNIFAGFEVSRRDVSGSSAGGTLGFDVDAVSLRLGYKY